MEIKTNSNNTTIMIDNSKYFYAKSKKFFIFMPLIVIFTLIVVKVPIIFFSIIIIGLIFNIILAKSTVFSNEKMILKNDIIIIEFISFNKCLKRYQINNNNSLNIKYGKPLGYFKTPTSTLFYPGKTRRLKLISDSQEVAFGFDLSLKELNILEGLILEQRKKYEEKFKGK